MATDIPTEKLMKLERALETSNAMQTFNLAKNNLKVKTQNLLSYSHNGGIFKVDQGLISFVNYVIESGKDTVVILDKNEIPIKIENLSQFLEDISSLYFEAVNEYYNDYEKLRSSRKIEKVLEI
jgi:hypothetical protein